MAWEIFGSDGNTADQLIAVVPDTTGAGAIQVLFAGRLAKPEIMLLADELATEELNAADETVIEDVTDEGDDLLPPPPPPQDNNIKQLVIKMIFLTQLCMTNTSSEFGITRDLQGLIIMRCLPE